MTVAKCPYVHISQAEASANLASNNSQTSENISNTNNTINSSNFSLVSKAEAQSVQSNSYNSYQVQTQPTLSKQLTFPFFLLLLSFFLFIIVMSAVYLYHLTKFNLKDPFIKNFIPVYIGGLIFLIIPLIFNLLS